MSVFQRFVTSIFHSCIIEFHGILEYNLQEWTEKFAIQQFANPYVKVVVFFFKSDSTTVVFPIDFPCAASYQKVNNFQLEC